MNLDFTFALYVFCMDYHSGGSSRGYRILSRLKDVRLRDSHIAAIQGNRHTRKEMDNPRTWEEWETARTYCRQLKRKYAGRI